MSSFLNQWLLRSGRFFFRYRNGIFPIIFIILFLLTRPALFLGSPTLDRYAIVFGILVTAAGFLFRLFVIGFAYIKRGGREGQVYADELVTGGLYAHVRNPMYLGNFLIIVGMGILYGSSLFYGIVIPLFAYVYLSIIMAEEEYLRKKFGPRYEAYEKSVNRFIPNFKGLRKSLENYRYDWKKAIRKDYGTTFASLVWILSILQWKWIWIEGYSQSREKVLALSFLYVPVLLFYVLARFLKKSGKLVS